MLIPLLLIALALPPATPRLLSAPMPEAFRDMLPSSSLASDDFSTYASTSDLESVISTIAGGTGPWNNSLYSDGLHGDMASIDPTVRFAGHATMKYFQPGGTYYTPQLHTYFPATTHLWYHAVVRFSPGFITTGTTPNSAAAYKLLSWGWNGTVGCGSGRVEFTNTSGYDFYENLQDCSTGSVTAAGGHDESASVTSEWTSASFYDYYIEVDHTNPSLGYIRLWISKSGTTPVLRAQAVERAGASPLPPASNISVGLNFNQTRAVGQSQALWWGAWQVVDGNATPNPFALP